MHACAKGAEATRAVGLFGGPEKPYMGSKQPPGQRQLPQDRQGRRAGKGTRTSPPETPLHQQPESGDSSEKGGLQTLSSSSS